MIPRSVPSAILPGAGRVPPSRKGNCGAPGFRVEIEIGIDADSDPDFDFDWAQAKPNVAPRRQEARPRQRAF
jgi:hypothetical protein